MLKPISKLLGPACDSELCDRIVDQILVVYGADADPMDMKEEERVVVLVSHVSGIIGNGGFNYLFEGDLPGDPHFKLTLQSFRLIGCDSAADAFDQALSLFPEKIPPRDLEERLQIYRQGPASRRGEIDRQFFRANKEADAALARYIRRHAESFKRLLRAESKRTAKLSQPESNTRRLDPVSVGIRNLPHWARVAFAAKCARRVFPFFETLWPNAWPERPAALLTAIQVAEQAAATGVQPEGLKGASLNACMTTGSALAISLYGYPNPDNEPGPADGTAAVRVSHVARSAHNAAEAALHPAKESAEFAGQAYVSAREVAWEMDPRIVDEMAKDFDEVSEAARLGGWRHEASGEADNDSANVEREAKPWWKFW